jgi:hypothetical protein
LFLSRLRAEAANDTILVVIIHGQHDTSHAISGAESAWENYADGSFLQSN